MIRCPHPGCVWQSIAASQAGARQQYADHLVEAHADRVEADIPDGMVQVRVDEEDDWRTMTPEQARAFHRGVHETDD
ncbi:MAG: hypothetical protein ABEI57_02700 [Halapricum sp.]